MLAGVAALAAFSNIKNQTAIPTSTRPEETGVIDRKAEQMCAVPITDSQRKWYYQRRLRTGKVNKREQKTVADAFEKRIIGKRESGPFMKKYHFIQPNKQEGFVNIDPAKIRPDFHTVYNKNLIKSPRYNGIYWMHPDRKAKGFPLQRFHLFPSGYRMNGNLAYKSMQIINE